MANYTVTDPISNKTVTLTGDSPPTEAELNDIFSKVSTATPQGISGQDIEQHPFQSIGKTIMQPAMQSLTGKSLEDMQREASQTPQFANTPTSRPFDANLGDVQDASFKGAVGAQLGDALTTPANYMAAPLIKGAVSGVAHTLGALPDVLNSAKGAQFAQSIRQAFTGVKSAAVAKFGDDLDTQAAKYPDKTVSLAAPMKNIIDNFSDMSSNAQSALRNTPILRDFLPKADGTIPPAPSAEMDNVKLSDVQKIINHMNTKIPSNIKSSDLDILNTLNDVKAAQLDAFPEMSGVRADYAKVAQPYKDVQQYFRFNKVLNGIKGGFGGDEGMQAVKKLLPPDVLQRIGGYKSAANLASLGKEAIPEALKLAGAGAVGGAIVKMHH